MLYPLKFRPVYKSYLWGGRNLERLGKALPEGNVAESWEISCHPDGITAVSNGEFEGVPLPDIIKKYGKQLLGKSLPVRHTEKFPLMVKLIDANSKLSVQVHPEDDYAITNENGELGKNEMLYIISAKPGAKLIYDVVEGTTVESFSQALKDSTVEKCLKWVEVSQGDIINIPAGVIHALGEGIVVAEIEQNSNATYRVYDYDRIDGDGNRRPLHIEKALKVINFNSVSRKEKSSGLRVDINSRSYKTYTVANRHFSVELYSIDGKIDEVADGSRFYIYVFTEGEGEIIFGRNSLKVKSGESVLIPSNIGSYSMCGKFKALKSYVPCLEQNIFAPLVSYGYNKEDIYSSISGLL
ncbi:MAG: class I mannose-6-phosphate isomerase [Clostridia bacterium]|nr:class I mannose-6-phosphate isomerase [Clostridia bacterium]